ncbi:hypothetical protein ABW20_dc0108795 [Dactylellina cionopaga]|nr:hypothetical protein ABW20_dc0108795 [Dactylellina cionopaga]
MSGAWLNKLKPGSSRDSNRRQQDRRFSDFRETKSLYSYRSRGDANSVYSFDAEAKSLYSFDSEAKSLYSLDESKDDNSSIYSRFQPKATGSGFTEAPPPQYSLLDWILFSYSPVGDQFLGLLNINDVVSLSQVCRKWREQLIPRLPRSRRFSKWFSTSSNHEHQWHPLVKSIMLRVPLPYERQEYNLAMGFYGEYNREVGGDLGRPNYRLSMHRLTTVFGKQYLSIITTVHLDGMNLGMINKGHMDGLNWLSSCESLRELSLRRCTGIEFDDLLDLLLEAETNPPIYKNIKRGRLNRIWARADKTKGLENLRKLMLWGMDGARQLSYPEQDEPRRYRGQLEDQIGNLMDVYQTDVDWCLDTKCNHGHIKGDGAFRDYFKALFSNEERCGICARRGMIRCLKCSDGNTCEFCLGFICDQCLVSLEVTNGLELNGT